MLEFLFPGTLWPEGPMVLASGENTSLRGHLKKHLVQRVSRKEGGKYLSCILEVQQINSVWLYQPCDECLVTLSPRWERHMPV